MSCKAHATLWNGITKRMNEGGVRCTVQQVQNRWKNLKRTFLSVTDNNSKTGASPKTCNFFAEFNEIYGTKSSTCPEATRELGVASCSTSNDADSEPCPIKVKRSNTATTQILDSINQQATRQIDLLKEMHNDKMERIDRLLDILSNN